MTAGSIPNTVRDIVAAEIASVLEPVAEATLPLRRAPARMCSWWSG